MPRHTQLKWKYEETKNGQNTTHLHTVNYNSSGARLNLPAKFELTKQPNDQYTLRVTMGNHLHIQFFEVQKKDGKIKVNYAMNYVPASSQQGASTSPVETQIKPAHYALEFKDALIHARVAGHPKPSEHNDLLRVLREIDVHLNLNVVRDLPKVDAQHLPAPQNYVDSSKITDVHKELFAALPRNKLISNFVKAIGGEYSPSSTELITFAALAHLLEIHSDVNFEPAGAIKSSVKAGLKIAINSLPDSQRWTKKFPKIFEKLEFKGIKPTRKN